ncbi:MAG: hypothetical protein GY810_22945 [Aureispira sp.]|nr:hypothetical protein [Aureispira sp.]
MIADKYHLKKSAYPKGLKVVMRDFPVIKGAYQDKYIQVYAGVSKNSYTVQSGGSSSRYKTPLTVVRVKPKQKMFNVFTLKAKKNYKLKKGASVDIQQFEEYFDLNVDAERLPLANSLLNDSVKMALLNFLVLYKDSSSNIIMDEHGFWKSELLYETRTLYRYQRASAMLDILLSISEHTNAIARQ